MMLEDLEIRETAEIEQARINGDKEKCTALYQTLIQTLQDSTTEVDGTNTEQKISHMQIALHMTLAIIRLEKKELENYHTEIKQAIQEALHT